MADSTRVTVDKRKLAQTVALPVVFTLFCIPLALYRFGSASDWYKALGLAIAFSGLVVLWHTLCVGIRVAYWRCVGWYSQPTDEQADQTSKPQSRLSKR